MQPQQSTFHVAFITALIFVGSSNLRADEHSLLSNSDFESAISTDGSVWQMFEISQISKDHARSGEQSMFNGGFSQTTAYPPYVTGNDSGAFQEFPAAAGSKWRLTGYGLTPSKLTGSPAFGLIQISFFDDEGRDLGTVETEAGPTKAKLSDEINAGSAVNEWIFLDTGIATAPEGTSLVRAFTLFVDYSGSADRQGVYFDDLALCRDTSTASCGGD